MIDAGVIELAQFDPRDDTLSVAAEMIFRAMFVAMVAAPCPEQTAPTKDNHRPSHTAT
jgi:hypothetical protein